MEQVAKNNLLVHYHCGALKVSQDILNSQYELRTIHI